MRRTDLMDTSEWAHREMVRRLREMTPEQRLATAMQASESSRSMFADQTQRHFDKLRSSHASARADH